MTVEPTILVKKADGSLARMTLSEVRALQSAQSKQVKQSTQSKQPTVMIADEFSHPFEELPAPAPLEELEFKKPLLPRLTPTVPKFTPRVPVPAPRPAQHLAPAPSGQSPLGGASRIFADKPTNPRPVMNDVVPPPPEEVGPIDEIKLFNITDFRRLSVVPVEAAARLGQKFASLRAESIIFYLDACRAWRQSPLYTEYLGIVARALNEHRPLANVIAARAGSITLPEIKALLTMEKELLI